MTTCAHASCNEEKKERRKLLTDTKGLFVTALIRQPSRRLWKEKQHEEDDDGDGSLEQTR